MTNSDATNDRRGLDELRQAIDGIDEQIVSLMAERQKVVKRVTEIKKAKNLPVYHPSREEDLVSSRRSQGASAGLDPDFIEELYRVILRQSRIEQTRRMERKAVLPGGIILIVGGRGEMGRYFERRFTETGYHVRILDKTDWPDAEKLCDGIHAALISVPIDQTDAIIRKLAPYLPKDAVLADITSIKASPLTAMLEAHEGPVVGFHPMFGPTTSSLDKQIVVATPGRLLSACQWLLDQFAAWGSVVVTADAREHDEVMDLVQALRHFASFAFGQFLYRKNIDLERTLDFTSPIYRLELGMVGRLFAQDPALYGEIIFASKERRNLLREYIQSLQDNLAMLEENNKERFAAEFSEIAEWFGSFSEQAMRESTYIIDKLIERF
ncbi:MAG: bifunctional chorismate mutase/prephenate dehydrogenase [Desulfobacterales bacterium]|nr:bifunctional chorismate mutase/prephenate dehydrogenase [Desulfobacterales bacterium]